MRKHYGMAKLVSASGGWGETVAFLRKIATEYPRHKDTDKLFRFFENRVPSAMLKIFLLEVAMEYNWRHSYRKMSWRRMNRYLRREALFRLFEAANGGRVVRVKGGAHGHG